MTRRQRSAFLQLLADFVATHPGTRVGSLFGTPAAFAGARVFAAVTADGLDCRLPLARVPSAVTRGRLIRPGSRRDWVTVSSSAAESDAPLALLLELCVAHVADRMYSRGR